MEENKNSLSPTGDSYRKEDVDAYFLRVQKQFEKLSAENKKLHKDCVHFAKQLKKIQDSGVLDEDLPELKRQNAQYRKEIAALQKQLNDLKRKKPSAPPTPAPAPEPEEKEPGYFNTPSEPEEPEPKKTVQPQPAAKTEPKPQTGGAVFFDDDEDEEPDLPRSGRKPHRVLRGFFIFFLIVFLILAVVSVVSGAIGHSKNPGTSFFGTRAYTIHNNNMASIADDNDIVFVRNDDYNTLRTGTVIVATPRDRSLAKIDASSNGALIVSGDNGQQYTVTQNQYLGVAKYKVENIGSFVRWAANNAVIYFLILAVIVALLILLIVLIPGKKRQPDETE